MAQEFTPQQINKIMDFVSNAVMRQKYDPYKETQKGTTLTSVVDLENHLKSINDVSGKLVRGFRDLLKIPRSVNDVFKDVERLVHDSTSRYAEEINKLTKANIESIKTHGANSKAVKQQTEGLVKSVNALKSLKESAKSASYLQETQLKASGRKTELENKSGRSVKEEQELKDIVELLKTDGEFTKTFASERNAIKIMLKDAIDGIEQMPADMQANMKTYLDELKAIQSSVEHGNIITTEQVRLLDKSVDIQSAILKSSDVANQKMMEHLGAVESQYKAMALAIGGMAVAVGKSVNSATLSRQGANLADNNFFTALRMGISASEMHGLAKTNTTELGLFSGSFNAGDALNDSGLMSDLQDTARKMGLIGVEGAKTALETFNFQLRSGNYDITDTKAERIQSAETFLNAVKHGAARIHMPLDEYVSEIKGLMDSGDLSPLMDQLDKSGLSGDAYTSALIENVTAIKANIRNLGLNSNYLKLGIELQKKASSQGFEELIRGKVGASIGLSTIQSFTGQKFTKEDTDLLMRFQDVKNLNLFEKDEQTRILDLLAPFKKEQDEILSRRAKGIENPGDMERLAMANTMLSIVPSDVTSQATLEMARESKRLRDSNLENKLPDGTTPMVNENKNALAEITQPLSRIEQYLLDIQKVVTGALSSPLGSLAGGAMGFAGSMAVEAAGGAGTLWAAKKMGLLKPDADPKTSGKGIGNILKGKKGKVLIAAGIAAALYGTYNYLSADGGGDASVMSGGGGTGGAGSIVGPNGEITNAEFSIQNAVLNIAGVSSSITGNKSEDDIEKLATYGSLGIAGLTVGSSLWADKAKIAASQGMKGKGLAMLKSGGMGLAKAHVGYSVASAGFEAAASGFETDTDQYAKYFGADAGDSVMEDLSVRTMGLTHDFFAKFGNAITFGYADLQTVQERLASDPEVRDTSVGMMGSFFDTIFGVNDQAEEALESNPYIHWIDENSGLSLPSKTEVQEEKAKAQVKTEEEKVDELKNEEIKEFMTTVVGFFEKIGDFTGWWRSKNSQEEIAARNKEDVERDQAEAIHSRVDAGSVRVNDALNRGLARVKNSGNIF